ncbi:MAG: CHASE2 domain-containing protein [Cyanothece sp. SIO2G6]|nr:CHASE2 domain-containing protein [Cyanothece sp. SIO2G6]
MRQERRIWITAVGVASGIILLKVQGFFQVVELAAFDQLIRLRPTEIVDDRIVIVGIDEDDISNFQAHPLSDATIAQVLENIKAQNPRVIGLDIYRHIPHGQGHSELQQVFRSTPNLIGIETIQDRFNQGVAAPQVLAELGQAGFNNVILDSDNRVRRNLLYWTVTNLETGEKEHKTSFSLMSVFLYLQAEGIVSQSSTSNELQLDDAIFAQFQQNDGGYVRADAGGYQILANFRNNAAPFPTISVTDVWAGNIPPGLMTDRIVFIGSTAPSLKDTFHTPFNGGLGRPNKNPISGVELHAHMASQVLSATLEDRLLLTVWPDIIEYAWIVVWAFVGSLMSWTVRSPVKSGGLLLLAGGGLSGCCYLAILAGVWIPLVLPLVALTVSAIAIISHIAHMEGELQKSKEFLNSVINAIPDPIFVKDKDYRWVVLNEAYCQFLGRSKKELMEQTEAEVLPSHQAQEFRVQDELTFATNGEQESEGELTNARGYTYSVAMKRSLHHDGAGNLFLVGVIHDITHRKRMEEELRRTAAELVQSNAELRQAGDNLRHMAYHDPLTGLPNRKLFHERFIQSIEWAETNQHVVALLFLDLDGFKSINDTQGHVVGDLLLKSVAQRLKGCLRGSDTVARLGGDEFVVILPGIPENQVDRVAKKILNTLAQPFVIQSHSVTVTTSIGISLYPFDGKQFDKLIVEADQAMYRSKEAGKNQYTFAHHTPSSL